MDYLCMSWKVGVNNIRGNKDVKIIGNQAYHMSKNLITCLLKGSSKGFNTRTKNNSIFQLNFIFIIVSIYSYLQGTVSTCTDISSHRGRLWNSAGDDLSLMLREYKSLWLVLGVGHDMKPTRQFPTRPQAYRTSGIIGLGCLQIVYGPC